MHQTMLSSMHWLVCILPFIHPPLFIHPCIYAYVHLHSICVHLSCHSFAHPFVHPFIHHSSMCPFIHSCICPSVSPCILCSLLFSKPLFRCIPFYATNSITFTYSIPSLSAKSFPFLYLISFYSIGFYSILFVIFVPFHSCQLFHSNRFRAIHLSIHPSIHSVFAVHCINSMVAILF